MGEICERCGKKTSVRGGVHVSDGTETLGPFLCHGCFNRGMAERAGLEFHHVEFTKKPIH